MFKITESGGATNVNQTYSFNASNGGLAAAQSFFHDDVFDLGALSGTNNLTVSFDLSLTSLGGGDGFDGDLVFGAVAVPEPATWLGGAGVACLLLMSFWKRRTRRHELRC